MGSISSPRSRAPCNWPAPTLFSWAAARPWSTPTTAARRRWAWKSVMTAVSTVWRWKVVNLLRPMSTRFCPTAATSCSASAPKPACWLPAALNRTANGCIRPGARMSAASGQPINFWCAAPASIRACCCATCSATITPMPSAMPHKRIWSPSTHARRYTTAVFARALTVFRWAWW